MDNLQEKIAKRAYELFMARGGQHGYHIADWLQAEKEMTKASPAPSKPAPATAAAAKPAPATAEKPKSAAAPKKKAAVKK
jgi:hypothetical protein